MSSLDFMCEYVLLNQISGENLQRGQKSRHRLEELLRKVDSTARDRHSPEVEEEEKHVFAQNCIFFRRDILGREGRLEKKNAAIYLFENAQTWSKTASTATGSTAAMMLREQNDDNLSKNCIQTIGTISNFKLRTAIYFFLCSPFVTLNFKL